jgi:hypothetical protein
MSGTQRGCRRRGSVRPQRVSGCQAGLIPSVSGRFRPSERSQTRRFPQDFRLGAKAKTARVRDPFSHPVWSSAREPRNTTFAGYYEIETPLIWISIDCEAKPLRGLAWPQHQVRPGSRPPSSMASSRRLSRDASSSASGTETYCGRRSFDQSRSEPQGVPAPPAVAAACAARIFFEGLADRARRSAIVRACRSCASALS